MPPHRSRSVQAPQQGAISGAVGRRLRFPKETPLCNLYLSMLHRMGIQEESFGDSKGPLPGLA